MTKNNVINDQFKKTINKGSLDKMSLAQLKKILKMLKDVK